MNGAGNAAALGHSSLDPRFSSPSRCCSSRSETCFHRGARDISALLGLERVTSPRFVSRAVHIRSPCPPWRGESIPIIGPRRGASLPLGGFSKKAPPLFDSAIGRVLTRGCWATGGFASAAVSRAGSQVLFGSKPEEVSDRFIHCYGWINGYI